MPPEAHATHPPAPSSELPRVLGVVSVVGIVVGSMIGSGIFINPAKVARDVGSPELMLLVWVVGGILSFFGALALAELGAAFPQAGGMYVYLREAYGPLVAFLFGWGLFLVIDAGTVATLAVAFSTKYLPFFFDLTPWASRLVAILLIAFLAVVNILGVEKGAFLQNVLTVIKFVALCAVSLAVFLLAEGSTTHFTSAPGTASAGNAWGSFGVALVAALWAYKGWETASFNAGELKNPEKSLPLGLLLGSLSVVVLYLLANLAYLYVFPVDQMAGSSRIAADAMQHAIGPLGASVIAFVILFSITGAANGNMLTGPRVYYAMARDGLFFQAIARVHPRFRTPHNSILALAVWSSVLCLTGTFEQLFTYVVFSLWIFMGLTAAAVVILRRKRPDVPRPYRTWGYPVTPVLFVLAALALSLNSLVQTPWESCAGLGIILVGIPVYRYWRGRQRGRAQ